jgi:cell division control protein 6
MSPQTTLSDATIWAKMVEEGMIKIPNKIILHPKVFSKDYVPDAMVHRNHEYQLLQGFVAPLIQGYESMPIMIFGPKGSGKTHMVKYFINHDILVLKQLGISVFPIYVSCLPRTSAKIMREIYIALTNQSAPMTGISPETYRDMIVDYMKSNTGTLYLIFLDDIEQMQEETPLLLLLTLNELHSDNIRYLLCGISSNMRFRERLSESVKSRLYGPKIVFSSYSLQALTDILTYRASIGLAFGSLIFDVAMYIAKNSYGDARRAIRLLYHSAMACEREGKSIITVNHVDAGLNTMIEEEVSEYLSGLSYQHKAVLLAIYVLNKKVKTEPVNTPLIYKMYTHICEIIGINCCSMKWIYKILDELISSGILESHTKSLGRKGGILRTYNFLIPDEEVVKKIAFTDIYGEKIDSIMVDALQNLGIRSVNMKVEGGENGATRSSG